MIGVLLINTPHTGQGGRKIGEGIAPRHTSQRAEEERKKTELSTRDKVLRGGRVCHPPTYKMVEREGKERIPPGLTHEITIVRG